MVTRETLHQLVEEKLADYLFVVVSNREPYIHTYEGNRVRCITPASGLTVALDPVMQASGGIWIAHGAGDADRKMSDKKGRVAVPPGKKLYTLKRVWLTKEEEDGYYYGFSNEALWPLCHVSYTRPIFKEDDWETYKHVNQRFADAVLEEVGDRQAFVFIQDYHFALLSRMIKEGNPNCITAQFWHIPWPNEEAFRICPWGEEILDGMLGNDLLGFHILHHCQNFINTVKKHIEAKVDYERSEITRGGKSTLVRPFPISVDFEKINSEAQVPKVAQEMKRLRKELGLAGQIIALGLDRIDYTKGIPERLRAVGRFLEKYPEYQGRFKFIQLGVLSRIHIQRYKDLNDEIYRLTVEINYKFKKGRWVPIILHKGLLHPATTAAFHCLADMFIVSSLHDGMNLVAKEFVSSRFDEDGVLILSQFTGAARQLDGALTINPYAIDDFAETIKTACEMPLEEKQKRMQKSRKEIKEDNIYRWAVRIMSELLKFEFKEVDN